MFPFFKENFSEIDSDLNESLALTAYLARLLLFDFCGVAIMIFGVEEAIAV